MSQNAVLATVDGLVAQQAAKRRSAEGAQGLASFVEQHAARWRAG